MSEGLFLSQKDRNGPLPVPTNTFLQSSQDMAMLFHPDEVRCFEVNKGRNCPPSASQYLSTSSQDTAMLFHLASEPTHLPLSHHFCSHSTYQCFTDMEFQPIF